MIGRVFTTVATALAGTGVVFFILETRRQRALLGETPPQTLERDAQATAALQDIMQNVRQDNLPDLLINGGTALMDMSLNALNERTPEVGRPLLTMFNGARAFSNFNSLMQNAAPVPASANTMPGGFSLTSLLNLAQPASTAPVQLMQPVNNPPVQLIQPAVVALQNESAVNEVQTPSLTIPDPSSSSSNSYSIPKP